jgi:hypothetical protein
MISKLASPSVCVIDDEEGDFRPILDALNELYVSAIHILGNEIDKLPQKPFSRLQLLFLDLHLTNSLGKDAASHTANVFLKGVSADTAPVIVVIWSKYADDKVVEEGVPPEDQETQSDLFKRTLFEVEPKFKSRLIFLEMEKPKKDRPPDWSEKLKTQIEEALAALSASDLLWTWDGLVKDASASLLASLTTLAEESAAGSDPGLTDGSLEEVLQRLAKAQGEGDLSAASVPQHLVAILSQLLMDQLEQPDGRNILAAHGAWLNQVPGNKTKASVAAKMNCFLLTSGPSDGQLPYVPGTVYRSTDGAEFCRVFGVTPEVVEALFCNKKRPANAADVDAWNAAVRPVVLEISPVCDVANQKRYNASLIGGLLVPLAKKPHLIGKTDALAVLPVGSALSLSRWPLEGFDADEVMLVFCHRLKALLKADALPAWLVPWFRLREIPTTSIRNLQMAQASRVGYVSLA